MCVCVCVQVCSGMLWSGGGLRRKPQASLAAAGKHSPRALVQVGLADCRGSLGQDWLGCLGARPDPQILASGHMPPGTPSWSDGHQSQAMLAEPSGLSMPALPRGLPHRNRACPCIYGGLGPKPTDARSPAPMGVSPVLRTGLGRQVPGCQVPGCCWWCPEARALCQ